jgi:peptide-methionine (S)-S-oxide reductase
MKSPHRLLSLIILCLAVSACGARHADPGDPPPVRPVTLGPNEAIATFGGGCFWCMEPPFDKLPGVISTTSGYMGGRTVNPTYEEVSRGRSGHVEVVQVVYDTTRVTYERLLHVFWRNIDPLTPNGQFCDMGSQYRSAIFYHDTRQQRAAESSKQELVAARRFTQPIVTELLPAARFYRAEEYHQDFYLKNPRQYQSYRQGCGRDRRLRELWGREAGG